MQIGSCTIVDGAFSLEWQVNDAQIDDWKFSLLINAFRCVNLIALFQMICFANDANFV